MGRVVIGFLKGFVLSSSPDHILLDVGGVGYSVRVPFSTYCEIDGLGGEEPLCLFIRTHVREDALELYGFLTEQEKRVFEELIAVSGIGPRLAQVVMSGMAWQDLLGALASGDPTRLTRIPGVGKKTSERMIVELRDSATKILAELEHEPPEPITGPRDDLISALVNLGYRRNEAEKAAASAEQEAPDDAAFPELLRLSLKKLSRA